MTSTTVAPAQLQRYSGRQARVQRHEANKTTTTQSIEAEGVCVRVRSPDSESAACASRVEKPNPTGDDFK